MKLLKNKHTSKHSLYIITFITLLISLIVVSVPVEYNAVIAKVEDKEVREEATVVAEDLTVEEQIRKIAAEENFQWPDYLVRLAYCESRLNPNNVGDNGHSRGLYQIHSHYWPNITDEQAFDIEWSTKWTMKMINDGYQHYWTCDKIIKGN